MTGCAALTNPVANGIPVHLLPPELLAESKGEQVALPLSLLRQKPPDVYRLAAGDVLGVYIDGVLGNRNELPPVHGGGRPDLPPAIGFPIVVRENGTVALPLIDPEPVQGMSIAEAEQALIHAYTVKKKVHAAGQQRVIVTLIRPRHTRILVIREDSPTAGIQGRPGLGRGVFGGPIVRESRKGTGTVVDLPAYENDVLTALTMTGGLPGTDALNEVVIQRGYSLEAGQRVVDEATLGEVTRIPLRMRPGEELPFRPEDIILHTGDIVLVQARDTELFYAGGLLLNGEYLLPRDYDMGVVQAVAQIGGPLVNGGFGGNNLSGSLTNAGIGSPSPSLLTVLRRTPHNDQVNIRVDLNRAIRDPRENILVQAGDTLILQATPGEAFARYMSSVVNLSVFSRVIKGSTTSGTVSASVP